MRRYHFLQKSDVYEALNKVRDALLASRDGNDVEQIMKGVLTFDERMKIGRRIQIAECLLAGLTQDEIKSSLKVGISTIAFVARNIEEYEKCFLLIRSRSNKVKTEFERKAYKLAGSSTRIFKTKEYTGFKRKDVVR